MRRIALGVGLTSACTFSCKHCYSGGGNNPVEMDRDTLFRFIASCDVESINLGTGESFLYPDFHGVLKQLFDMKIPVALTTAGPSIEALSDQEVEKLHDVDFSLDFPDREAHDQWRAEGAFDMALRGIERCRSLGVTASVAMCLMKQNAPLMGDMCALCRDLGVSLRVNVYKAVKGKEFEPDYDSFWHAIQVLYDCAEAIVSSEPVVNAALRANGFKEVSQGGSPCGISSLRLRPGGEIMPCVYWDHSPVTMENFLSGEMSLPSGCDITIPEFCDGCDWFNYCRGGCSGRRLYSGRSEPDIYCFMKDGCAVPELAHKPLLSGDSYIHSSYLCTIIAEFSQ
ncbi:MAG: radical SAM protein [Candidatus Fermentibacteria bacterium]|nr:radical SAM protein [Candidatus Fermentibacteria bacterium]